MDDGDPIIWTIHVHVTSYGFWAEVEQIPGWNVTGPTAAAVVEEVSRVLDEEV